MLTKHPAYQFSFHSSLACVLLMLAVSCNAALATGSGMRYENAGTYLDDGVYYLDAFARLEMGEEQQRALVSGVELHFLVEVMVQRKRRWWLDTSVLERRLRYKLYFYELTRHYRVEDLQTGTSVNYKSLTAALRFLGQINRYALIEGDRLKGSARYTASIAVSLDNSRLPGPLAARAIVSSDWDMQSEEFKWSLN